MLSSTKRYVLHAISLTLAIICLSTGLVMKYGDFEQPPVFTEQSIDPNLEVNTVSFDSLGWYADAPTLNNPDD